MKKGLILLLSICLFMGNLNETTIYASETEKNGKVVSELLDVQVYDNTQPSLTKREEINNSVIILGEDAKKMTDTELAKKLDEKTKLSPSDIQNIIKATRLATSVQSIKEDTLSSTINTSGNYISYFHEYSWAVAPHITKTETWVDYTTSWIGIDAYRSSVGLKKSFTESLEVTKTFTYSGSLEIKKIKGEFSKTSQEKQVTTISTEQECPAWTTMNWRPYIAFYRDFYEGIFKDLLYGVEAYTGNIVLISSKSTLETGTYDRLRVRSDEVWSRENTAKITSVSTPLPPSGPPAVY